MSAGKTCAIHQPNFLARTKTLAKVAASDILVVLDNVQYNARDYQNRTLLAPLAYPARLSWFTWAMRKHDGRATKIKDLEFADRVRDTKHLMTTLHHNYVRAERYDSVVPDLLSVIRDAQPPAKMWVDSMVFTLGMLDWKGEVLYASELNLKPTSSRSGRLADLVREVGASTYLCGTGGRRYLDLEEFNRASVEVVFSSAEPTNSDTNRRSGLDSILRWGVEPLRIEVARWRVSINQGNSRDSALAGFGGNSR